MDDEVGFGVERGRVAVDDLSAVFCCDRPLGPLLFPRVGAGGQREVSLELCSNGFQRGRLEDCVVRAVLAGELDTGFCVVLRTAARQRNDFDVRIEFANFVDQPDPGHVRHDDIGDHQVDGHFLEEDERFHSVGGVQNGVAALRHHFFNNPGDVGFVIDN